ncbi:MAG: hypothetical protein IKU77_04235 [Alistipes sp.]|nr:hypothetical protein [Alistipes sp.]
MKKYVILTLFLLLAFLTLSLRHYYLLARRLELDRYGLVARIETLQSDCDSINARCEVLRLDREEFERLYREEHTRLHDLKIRLRRVESLARHVGQTTITATIPLHDSVMPRNKQPPIIDTVRHFAWNDRWNRVEGVLTGDSIHCRILSIDTLHQIVHRVPHRFLFLRWGTKALRQEIRSTNPSTRIVYTDYVIIAD